ncbi:MAG: cytochrome c1 [Pseudoprimorskyibacter sp.]|nr:cytochrome c1 [Pseudoprimorskyibacter sp.]
MFKQLAFAAVISFALPVTSAFAAGGAAHIEDFDFSFEGPLGTFDENQLQRGLQIYTEGCSGCHGLRYVPIRTLADAGGPHLPADQVRAYAEQNFEIFDADLDDYRVAKETDNFPANDSAGAPDLSLMAKARAGFHGPLGTGINQLVKGMGGAEYIASLLTGYTGEEKEEAGVVLYENTAFPGGWISMPPPLYDDMVEFVDGHAADTHHLAEDISAFLMWTAEPKMMARQQTGLTAVIFLSLLTVLLYLTNKRIWAPIKRAAKSS